MSRRLNCTILGLLLALTPLSRAAESSEAAGVADPNFPALSAATAGFQAGLPTGIRWTEDGSAILFLRSGPRDFVRDLYTLDPATGQEDLLLTAQQILQGAEEQLSAQERARRERQRQTARGIAAFELSRDGSRILFNLSGRLYWVERRTRKVHALESSRGAALDARFSPDGQKVACVRDNDLVVVDLTSGAELQLTTDAKEDLTNGLSEFVAQEEMGRFRGYWWSPDSQSILYQQTDTSALERMHILNSADPLAPAQAWAYPRPGQKNAKVRLGLIPVTGGVTRWLDWDAERWPYLATVRWEEKHPLTILVQSRAQTEEVLMTVDPASGTLTTLLVERDPAWLNLDQSVPHWLPDASAFLWSTERNGAYELELRKADGSLDRVLLDKDFGYRDLLSVDRAGKEALVEASADPKESHVYRVALDGSSPPVALTQGSGRHKVLPAPDHRKRVVWADTPTGPSPRRLVGADGAEIAVLKSVAEKPPFWPQVQFVTVGTEPAFEVSIVRPRDFRADRQYPVIDSVYGGPGVSVVTASVGSSLTNQWIADHGFIVVSIDGRGTPHRGRAWERAIQGDFISLPLDDHATALQELGKRFPEMDLQRVGVYGWSFGGYFAALAVMRKPEVYRAAVAGAPVADWLFYDTHYTERYLGLPDAAPEAYRKSSVLTYAPDLTRPLLLVHGTTDDNVYFLHSLRIADALLRAGKTFEFLPLVNFTHMVAKPEVKSRLNERILEFFQRHLAAR